MEIGQEPYKHKHKAKVKARSLNIRRILHETTIVNRIQALVEEANNYHLSSFKLRLVMEEGQ